VIKHSFLRSDQFHEGGYKEFVKRTQKDEIATTFYARKQLTQKWHDQIICKAKPQTERDINNITLTFNV
jgi:hypothetical protein